MDDTRERSELVVPRTEEVRLDLQRPEDFQREVQIGHARTRNQVALILTSAVVLSLPVFLIAWAFSGASHDDLDKVFDRWLTVVGPLAGAAVGAYGVSVRS